MNPVTAAASAAAGILATAATLGSSAPAAKCFNAPLLFPDAPVQAFVVNGMAVERDSAERVPPHSIARVEVLCADEMYERFEVRVRQSGLVIFTQPGPDARLREAVDSLAALQAAFHRREGRFAATARELGWSDPAGLITVALNVEDDGARWTATATHRHLGRKHPGVTTGGHGRPHAATRVN